MNWFRAIAAIGYRQTRNLAKLAMGRQLSFPSLGSMTLDADDVKLAQKWLNRQDEWYCVDEIEQYHHTFAFWNGSEYAFSFMGARVALSAAIYALGLEPGDEVILPGYTCIVVPNAFHFVGVKTIYSDIELDTYGLDASQIEDKITPRTKAILLHHLYGLVSRDYDVIVEIARRYGLFVIEDCAQSTGAEYRGRKVGNLGDVAIYSSEQSKIFNTIQGGIATTNDKKIGHKLREFYEQSPFPDNVRVDKLLHNVIINYYRFKHPQRWWLGDLVRLRYGSKVLISTTREEERGVKPIYYGQKMPAPIAALGINQLEKIDTYNQKRRDNAQHWHQWCEKTNHKKPFIIPNSVPVFLRYPVLVEPEKKKIRTWACDELGIELGVWFVSHLHPVQQEIKECPMAKKAIAQCINFPTTYYNNEKDQTNR